MMSINEFFYLGHAELYQFQRWGVNFALGIIGIVYLVCCRKRGDDLREMGLLALLTGVLLTMPGISWLMIQYGLIETGRNMFEIVPAVIFIADASADVIRRSSSATIYRRVLMVVFLLFLIPIGISVGDHFTMDNITRSKSLTGISNQTADICNELHALYGHEVDAVLPKEFQMEVGIADTGVRSPIVDNRTMEDTTVPYILSAWENKVHVLVLPMELAEKDVNILSTSGFHIVKYLGAYEIWADIE